MAMIAWFFAASRPSQGRENARQKLSGLINEPFSASTDCAGSL
jgi:hypothetical protein